MRRGFCCWEQTSRRRKQPHLVGLTSHWLTSRLSVGQSQCSNMKLLQLNLLFLSGLYNQSDYKAMRWSLLEQLYLYFQYWLICWLFCQSNSQNNRRFSQYLTCSNMFGFYKRGWKCRIRTILVGKSCGFLCSHNNILLLGFLSSGSPAIWHWCKTSWRTISTSTLASLPLYVSSSMILKPTNPKPESENKLLSNQLAASQRCNISCFFLALESWWR